MSDNRQSVLGSPNATFSYASPSVTSVYLEENKNLMNTKGGDFVILTGDNFGTTDGFVSANYGPSSNPAQYQAISCTIVDAHVKIKCLTIGGSGTDLKWTVIVAEQSSNLSTDSLSYEPPVILGLSGPGAAFALTRGGQKTYLTGRGFGPTGEITPQVKYGGSNADKYVATNCIVESDNRISCISAAGTGVGHAWQVIVAGQESGIWGGNRGGVAGTTYAPPATFRYVVAEVGVPDIDSFATIGGEKMKIIGDNFGKDTSTIDSVTYVVQGKTVEQVCCVLVQDQIRCFSIVSICLVLSELVRFDTGRRIVQ